MSAVDSDTLLEVRNLEVRYGAALAVRGVNLRVKRGELVAIIGGNGAGKTSILRGISGLIRPSGGQVVFRGENTSALSADVKVKRGLAMVPEGRLIFADQTVEDNLILGAYTRWRHHKAEVSRDIEELLALFPRLRERFYQQAGSLSGGEQQMLAVARGLLSKPELLLIDELSLGLAPKVVAQLITMLQQLNAKGQTILLVEQLASYALAIAQRAYVVSHGRIEMEGDARVLVNSPKVIDAFLGKKKSTTKA